MTPMEGVVLRVVRSRRRRTAAAVCKGQVWELRVPAGLPPDVEQELLARLQSRLRAHLSGRAADDRRLLRRAQVLNRRYLGGRAPLREASYSVRQGQRWGSATVETGTIRLSAHLLLLPAWVEDYVILHELCHLLVPDHSPAFWRLVRRYPLAERARGFLQGWQEAQARGLPGACPPMHPEADSPPP